MGHKKPKQSTGSWAGNRDQHQGVDKRKAAEKRRKDKPEWVQQGKNTSANNQKPPKSRGNLPSGW